MYIKTKNWKTALPVVSGIVVNPQGIERTFFAERKKITSHFAVPVVWEGSDALMYFNGLPTDHLPNPIATKLLGNSHMTIRGQVLIATQSLRLYKIRAWASERYVSQAIAHLTLTQMPIMIDISANIFRCDVYAATAEDQFYIKMAL